MGKSSSSSKIIKHSKDSSNKLRSVKKKKSKRNKSKKIRRIKESESSGSDSSSYSSSEDDYRRKKKRRTKLSKKRSRKRYSSSESDDDDDDGDDRLLKKKKISKRKDGYVGKKKKKVVSRKRRKRDLSSSSTSSEPSDNDGSESDGKRRSRDRGRRLGEVKAARSRSRYGLEGESEPDECWQVEDDVMTEKNPRRLKSIVVVSYSYGNDERKEEDDRDVYMTRGGNRELGDSEESDERDGETTVSYSRSRADDNGFGEYSKSETNKSSHTDNSLKDDDLEAILKKRALENLKRFRGVTQKSGIAKKEVSSVSEGEPMQIESEKVEESQDHGLMEQQVCDSEVSKDLETSEKILHVVNVKESGTALANSASQQDQQSGDTATVKASSGISSCSTKRKLVRPILGKDSLNLASRKEASGSQDAEAESIDGSTIDKNCLESTLALVTKNEGEHIEPTKVRSTLNAESSSHADTEAVDEIKGRSQSEQKMDETKDESQYEQKTMTVMRGGEMVQVSYKVYIPKKTSSLGRRKLNR
ncbi:hypothetical protein ISN45_Aa08g017170 [Arabidopsis thaliana x Arabidopsis arenosa]|uniref:Uncharacterized protein n=1 Tax=Arabidopsis thaliana x Arabidopsis arenosa TaxID=1240361 RepID=A0A8T1XNF7_9BRAS|nr:hypothetical protein ISN45_Aa08g017170 [Arabidopsis thaliana x Arabidopsis arenosa]